ncbi:MAG: lipoprotein insertase outer membrane protein LolB [Gammaproteobacteria bacterium]
MSSVFCFSIKKTKLSLLLLSVLFMAACVSTPPPPADDVQQQWNDRTDYLYGLEDWSAQIALIGNSDQQKFKTRVEWTQQAEHYQIKLRDFIGRTIAIIDGSPSGVVAKTSKGQRYQGEDADALIEELFAINIPVSGMRYWLQGIPVPNERIDQLTLKDHGLASRISQQGWEISYPYYLPNDPYKMPSQVILEFENIRLSAKITQWTLQ